MINSIVMISEDAPFGKNAVVEAFRMATGLLAVGDIEDVKVILMKDAVHFLRNNLNPKAINADSFDNIMKLIEYSEIEIFVHDDALKKAGMEREDLVENENLQVVDIKKISQLISDTDMSFKY
jgi:sulfur relay (sulfurtransferase) DsrF/TusC family protein